MKSMKLFFINQGTSYTFNSLGKVIIILATLLICYIIIRNSGSLRKNLELNKKINILFISLLILQQVFLTIQNIFLPTNNVLDLFPLCISRISIVLLVVAILKNNSVMKNMSCCLGLFIGIYSLMVTNIFEKNYIYESLNYFGYMILVCAITYIISIEGFKLEKKILKNILIFTNIYSVFLISLGTILDNNYNFINGNISTIYNTLSKSNYIVLSLIFINLSIGLSYFLIKFILWEIDANFKLEYKTIIEKDKLNKAELE